MSLYEFVHTKIVPPLFLVVFTLASQLLTLTGRDEPLTLASVAKHSLGNAQAWTILFMYVLWVLLSLKIPSSTVTGPALPSGFEPQFKANGILFFWSTLALFGGVFLSRPDWALAIHGLIPELFGAINITAFLLCLWLLVKGKLFPEEAPEDGADTAGSLLFDFYRGVELHPTFLGVSVKQLVICRFGVMGWMLLSLVYFVAAIQLRGFSYPFFVSALVQLVYTLKFSLYESAGYFDSIDIAFDRAGYYLIWGSMVWMPGFYGLHAYNFVSNPPITSPFLSLFYLILGIGAIVLEYRIDYEKYLVRSSTSPTIMMYGKPAEVIHAEYTDQNGKKRTSRLVASGFWGLARHLNYVFEVIIYVSITAPGFSSGLIPFLLPSFMIILLLHRLYRDEQKCKKKYGKYWELYCSKVPYRLIPWIY
ncbi:unnamed protein product [Bemisia tabaci]|uniref:7-dehydrocholesterol reductase n=1 Tax=Bemisia tabaci TaxID=7038 RepID=A0A9P0A6B2_BEMTA|nr:unnamed protein product [Bemisia tabaci]